MLHGCRQPVEVFNCDCTSIQPYIRSNQQTTMGFGANDPLTHKSLWDPLVEDVGVASDRVLSSSISVTSWNPSHTRSRFTDTRYDDSRGTRASTCHFPKYVHLGTSARRPRRHQARRSEREDKANDFDRGHGQCTVLVEPHVQQRYRRLYLSNAPGHATSLHRHM